MTYDERVKIIDDIFVATGGTSPEDRKIWCDGEEILSKDENVISAIADLIDMIANTAISCTGYYDPAEDERDGCVDEHTGYYYVTVS